MNWSSSTLVKSGISYCSYTATGIKPERWGDYTGICRKHNEVSATVWINGMFGTAAHNWETWIAEITLFEGLVNAGKNQFTFNKSNLESGIYYIKIMSSNRTIQNEKIVIAN
jgi:hypothetical protein